VGALAVLVVFGAVAGGLAWLALEGREQERRRDFDRAVHARKLGWTYVGRRIGRIDYRFAGDADGIAWQMWYDSDRGDESPTPRAYWQCANLKTPALALVIIGRRRFELESGLIGQLLMEVASGVARAMSGAEARSDKSEFYQAAVLLTDGLPGLGERFAVAIAPEMPRGWIDLDLQSLLMQWPAGAVEHGFKSEDAVEINLNADGLKIVVQRMPQEFACWEHLARLGIHLAQRLALTR
jgi:hypothetical protein